MHVLRYFHQPPKATTNTVVVNNTAILTVSAALNNKVDKSAGRGLSQNNYSTPEKNKLGGVEEGAEVNVLADWNELNIESDAYILNKPESLPASDVYEWAKLPTKPSYTPIEIGLGNVTNDAQVKRSEMGVANGVATLNQDGLIPAIQLPSYVDDVLEYSSASYFPRPGTDGKIYVDTTTNLTYRWSGSDYVEISKSLALGETSSTAYRGDRGKTAYTHATDSSRLTTATSVGLYKVGCTAQGHISGLTAITKADITGLGIPAQDTNTTYSFAGGTNKFTVTPSGGTAQDVTVTPSISAATQSAAGLMSAADKKKLDGIAAGAQVNSVTGVKGNSESSYRTGNVNITATNIGLSNVANLDLSKAIKSITRSGTTFTYTCLDGTTGTFTLLDNNTTYSGSSTVTLNGTTFSITKNNIITALGYTPAEEGASEDYLPLTGGTVTGPVEITNEETVWFLNIKDITSKNLIGFISGVDTSTARYFSVLAKSGYDCEIGPNNGRYLYMKASTNRGGIGTQDPSYKFEVVGTVGANDFVNRSDIRDKNIIQQYNIPITAIAQAPAFAFTWKNNEEDSSTHIGSSAQYWKEVVPEAVKTADDDKGTLSMQYDVLALLSSISMAKTVLEMQNKIDTLERRIEQLEAASK